MKSCPFCAEEIQDAAKICKHCGRDLAVPPPAPTAVAAKPTRSGARRVLAMLAILVGLFFAAIVTVIAIAVVLGGTQSSATSGPALKVFLHRGTHGLRITNETDAAWSGCTATVLGDYEGTVGKLSARETKEIYYSDFTTGTTALVEDDGYSRALRSTVIACFGDGGKRQHVTF